MKISIVTISFNQMLFLKETIDSVLSQQSNLYEIEYIIVDPGSVDGSRELITSYGDKIIQIFENDLGPADGLNKGFSIASGDIYYFLNSDDVLLPGTLEYVYHFYSNNPNFDILMGGGYLTDKSLKPFKRIIPTKFTVNNYLYGAISFLQQGIFFKSFAFKKVGGFNKKNKTCWDGELFLSMAKSGFKFRSINRPLALFRLHEQGISGSGRLVEAYRTQQDALFMQYKGRKKNYFDSTVSNILKLKRRFVNLPILLYVFLMD